MERETGIEPCLRQVFLAPECIGEPRHKRGGAGDGDRTRDIQLGKLAFYR